MPRPVLALLTDFGLRDHYVAAMKAVVLGIAPEATLVDITHEIAPQDVVAGAIELAACWRDFPDRTTFLVVVDPGVGTARRAIAARVGQRSFVAPDNGVLDLVFDAERPAAVVELTARRYLRSTISRTFEGRDRFAPAAAWLALGTEIGAFGAPVGDWTRLELPEPRTVDRAVIGEVLKVDRFGNLVSNITADLLSRLGDGATIAVRVDAREPVPLVETYGIVAVGQLCALVGSSGRVEVAANGDSAARLLGAGRGARVVVAADRSVLEVASRQ